MPATEYGYCECGCERLAPIAKMTKRSCGHVAGAPVRFIQGHNARKPGSPLPPLPGTIPEEKRCPTCDKSFRRHPKEVPAHFARRTFCSTRCSGRATARLNSQRALAKNPPNHRASLVERAWAAGLFEGEGCFSVSTRSSDGPYVYAAASLSMTDEDEVRRFHEVLGVGNINGGRDRRALDGHSIRALWHWKCGSRDGCEHVALTLAPWLGQRRLVQAASALAQDTRRSALTW